MTMTFLSARRLVLGSIAAPLVLGLAACGNDAETTVSTANGEPIAAIPAPEGQSWSEVVEQTPEGGYRMGNPQAPVQLIEFASLTCPHCADFAAASSEDLQQQFVDTGRVSYELRNFVMNPLDLTMAMLVRCGSPESFFALTEQTFANQMDILNTWSQTNEAQLMQAANQPPQTRYRAMAEIAGLTDFFAARGISEDQARSCLAEAETAENLVQMTERQSNEFDITGTPAFLINGNKIEGNTWPDVRARLESLGAR